MSAAAPAKEKENTTKAPEATTSAGGRGALNPNPPEKSERGISPQIAPWVQAQGEIEIKPGDPWASRPGIL